jgi:monoamine oxidase
MARTSLFSNFERLMRQTHEGVSRRSVLGAGLAASAAVATKAWSTPRTTPLSVGIVGGGLAGLTCAYELKRAGFAATVHEAAGRVGGRVWSMGGAFPGPVTFPGQVVERGGELIDTGHKAMLGYATEFNLAKENYLKDPGETFYVFDGVRSSEAQVVAELRDFTAIMRRDLQTLSAAPTFFSNTQADRALDQVSLAEYLHTRGAGPLLTKVLTAAYEAEYGLSAAEQSCFNLLYFIRVNNRSAFQPFGVSDERYHLIDGNEGVVRALAQRLPGQLRLGERLERARKTPAGQVELTFRVQSRSVTATYDAVVFAIPFSVLRDVQLDANMGFSPDKRRAIATLGYGTNAKLMVGFAGPYWAAQGCNGSTYSNLPNHQATWETNADRASTTSAVLTDYSSAAPPSTPLACRPKRSASSPTSTACCRARWPACAAPPRAPCWRTSSTGRATRSRRAATPPTAPGSSPRWPAWRGSPRAIASSPESTPTRSTCGRATWRARCCRARTRPAPSSPR